MPSSIDKNANDHLHNLLHLTTLIQPTKKAAPLIKMLGQKKM